MGRWTGKACRLISMLSLTFSFFLVELVVGYATGSLALVADSFHMLSDVVALIVGLLSVRVSCFFILIKLNCHLTVKMMLYCITSNHSS